MPGKTAFRIALIADAHFHDPAGDFGIGLMQDGRRLALRSWAQTATAGRAFNESAPALIAALDRITAAGIRHVVLAGDYTDDGQAENIRRLVALLHRYRHLHGLRFYAIPGNHDLYAIAGKHVATRFLTAPGISTLVTSDPDTAQTEAGAVLTPAMRCAGATDALPPMVAFGLFRQPEDLHWESPFGPSDTLADRSYVAASADGSTRHRLTDASYLVEPEPGLWLLMIDATVFEPRPGIADPHRKRAFLDPANGGWNAVLRVKPFLLAWIASVTARARAMGKVLVPVSHYPVLPPFAAADEGLLFGTTPLSRRIPGPAVAQALIAAGLRFHLGGHLHVNCQTEQAGLTDVSMPSTTAFPPAFTILTAGPDQMTAKAVSLADISSDTALRALYHAEGAPDLPPDFGGFLAAQFRARVRHHRLPRDLPPPVLAAVRGMDLHDLLALLTPEPLSAFAQRHRLHLTVDQTFLTACDVIADGLMLREGGDLAALPDNRVALCRALAADFGHAAAHPRGGHDDLGGTMNDCGQVNATHPILSPATWIRLFLSGVAVSLRQIDDRTVLRDRP